MYTTLPTQQIHNTNHKKVAQFITPPQPYYITNLELRITNFTNISPDLDRVKTTSTTPCLRKTTPLVYIII